MVSPETTKPFQFELRSIFLPTTAVGVAFGLLRWLGPFGFFLFVIVAVQCSAVIVIMIKSKGTAWPGVVIPGVFVAVLFIAAALKQFNEVGELLDPTLAILFASLAAWFGGGLAASEAAKSRSLFLRWSLPLQFAWVVIVCVIVFNYFIEGLRAFRLIRFSVTGSSWAWRCRRLTWP